MNETAAGIAIRPFDIAGRRLWNSAAARRETEFIANEIFRDHCYEQHGIQIRDGDVVVDAGANIGVFTLSLLERFVRMKIVAVEPSPVSRACLERNLAPARRPKCDVRILDCALGAEAGRLKLTYFPNAPGNSTLKPEEKQSEVDRLVHASTPAQARTLHALLGLMPKSWVEIALKLHFAPLFKRTSESECSVRRLSEVMAEQGLQVIDLLKIDVEGFEGEVIRGIDEGDWPKIRQLVMEVSPANKPMLPDLSERLQKLGFLVFVESPGGTAPTPDNPLGCLVFARRS